MAKIGVRVEATEENTQQRDFGDVPNGDYLLEVSANNVNINNEGQRDQTVSLSLTIDILEPEDLKGRKIFQNYNLEHHKAQVQEIGQKQFACLLRALGLTESPDDADELMFKSFSARIGMGKDSKDKNANGSPKYAARNEIKKYYYPDQGDIPEPSIDADQPVARAQAPANDNKPASRPAASAAAGGSKPKPWGAK